MEDKNEVIEVKAEIVDPDDASERHRIMVAEPVGPNQEYMDEHVHLGGFVFFLID